MGLDLKAAPKCLQNAVLKALDKQSGASAMSAQAPALIPTEPYPEEIRLTVYGHAKPSVRITEKGKKDKKAQDYLAWQELVAQHCLFVKERPVPWRFVSVEMLFYFVPPVGNETVHADRINIGKSTEDGLAWGGLFPARNGKPDDSCVVDGNVGVRYCRKPEEERVEITLREFKMPEPVD